MSGKVFYLVAFCGLVYWGMNFLGHDQVVLRRQSASFVQSHAEINVRFGVVPGTDDKLVMTPGVLGIKAVPSLEYSISYTILNTQESTAEILAVLGPVSENLVVNPKSIRLTIPPNQKAEAAFTFVLKKIPSNDIDTIKLDLVANGAHEQSADREMRSDGSPL
jgi:hypothetical protein